MQRPPIFNNNIFFFYLQENTLIMNCIILRLPETV